MNASLRIILLFVLMLGACTSPVPTPTAEIQSEPEITELPGTPSATTPPTETPIPTASAIPTNTPTFTPSPTPLPVKIARENAASLRVQETLIEGMHVETTVSPDGQWIGLYGDETALLKVDGMQPSELGGRSMKMVFTGDSQIIATLREGGVIEIYAVGNTEPSLVLDGKDYAMTQIAWSGDGLKLASLGEEVAIWDADSGKRLQSFAIPGEEGLFNIEWTADGRRLIGTGASDLVIWDVIKGEVVRPLEIPEGFGYSHSISPDGEQIAVFGIDELVRVYDDEQVIELKGHKDIVDNAKWSPDGQFLVSSSEHDPEVILWRVSNWSMLRTLTNHRYWVGYAGWSPDGRYLATTDAAGTVYLRNPTNGTPRQQVYNFDPYIEWSPDSSMIVGIGWNELYLYDIGEKAMLSLQEDLIPRVTQAAWLGDRDRVLLRNGDGRVQLLDTISGNTVMLVEPAVGSITSMAYSPGGKQLALGENGGGVLLYDFEKGQLVKLDSRVSFVKRLDWAPDGDKLGILWGWNDLAIWDVDEGEAITSFPEGLFWDFSWGVDSDQILLRESRTGDVYLWDLKNGERAAFYGSELPFQRVEFAPGGSQFAVIKDGFDEAEILLWDIDGAAPSKTIALPGQGYASTVHWSPDGTRLGLKTGEFMGWSLGWVDSIQVYDVQSEQMLFSFELVDEPFTDEFAWSPDGRMLALANGEILDASSGAQLVDLFEGVGSVAWSPDGYTLTTAVDNSLVIWEVEPQR